PQDILLGLYNPGMTTRPKKQRRTGRPLIHHRLIEQRLTEQRNPASRNLDGMTAMEIVRLMNREDRKVAVGVGREIPAIARAVDAIVSGIRKGGRLIYVGAGSSGRMGVLDAAECPPTFGTSPKLVQALIAGGRRAITRAVEGAEDSARNGERDLRAKKLTRNDVVVGIAASGTTPYVLGALKFAQKRCATTVAVTSNLRMPVGRLAAEASGKRVSSAEHALRQAGHDMRMALVMLKRGIGAAEAAKRLQAVRGDLRKALGA